MNTMERKIRGVNTDLCEVESLLNVAKRQRVKNFLSIELRKLIAEKQKLEEHHTCEKTTRSRKIFYPEEKSFHIKIENYAWEQSPKFVKLFLTLRKVHQVDPENIKCQFGTDNMTLIVRNLGNEDYVFNITELLHPVVPEKSFWRIESDTVVIFLVKTSALKWQYLTKTDREKVDEKKNQFRTERSPAEVVYEKRDDQ